MKQHKIPERMCVSCRQMHPKTELLRLVATAEGGVSLDKSGKAGGRGVYICDNPECIGRTLKNKGFARANGFPAEETKQLLEKLLNGQD